MALAPVLQEKLSKFIEMMNSDNLNEAENAFHKATRLLASHGMKWRDYGHAALPPADLEREISSLRLKERIAQKEINALRHQVDTLSGLYGTKQNDISTAVTAYQKTAYLNF